MKYSHALATLILGCCAAAGSARAAGFSWQDHLAPFSFLFGNHIDTHLETKLNRDGTLNGFFYVHRLDENSDGVPDVTADGLPVFGHCTKPEDYATCQAGWNVKGYPCIKEVNGCTAMFLYHKDDHPVWLIGPRLRMGMDGQTYLAGTRAQVPQPGRPTHWHWLTEGSTHEGTLLPSSIADIEDQFGISIAVDPRCNVAMAEQLTSGVICPGYFLELDVRPVSAEPPTAPGPAWAFKHGGEAIPVLPGPDLRTHINYVTSYVSADVPSDSLPPPGDGGAMGGDGGM
jgi:hypothetical protein